MSPQAETLEIPQTLTLRPRATCQPNGIDERPVLRYRADESRVFAQVERWSPDAAN